MVNPTGYTALDMIGFTDQGAYSSSDNYVKNDLVHYSGNIWRCLIDDTSGIAPAEGVNWTLFIGEPTNLVERIIAPLETDPATDAWAVGRQIIYNDNLYEVITAITAGDSLVTYEDDPNNANIKLADPVETQVLAQKTQIQALTNNISGTYLPLGIHVEIAHITADGVKTNKQLIDELHTAVGVYKAALADNVKFRYSCLRLGTGMYNANWEKHLIGKNDSHYATLQNFAAVGTLKARQANFDGNCNFWLEDDIDGNGYTSFSLLTTVPASGSHFVAFVDVYKVV